MPKHVGVIKDCNVLYIMSEFGCFVNDQMSSK